MQYVDVTHDLELGFRELLQTWSLGYRPAPP
jgi:hypothetical protein